ncbi:hypothetical protein AGMMS50276_07260 [Synergistales bacterium]|nr:hypothetical protein AGMMS50276_07260 [Synergistales bacterium]
MINTLENLLSQKKNFIFLGETGSGKSEVALNFAVKLAEGSDREKRSVQIFDMDQTKPLFRSRDLRETMERRGIAIRFSDQMLDAPTLVSGVAECLADPKRFALLDIGGGETAARMAGGFARFINEENSAAVYVINPYRPWSKDTPSISDTMSYIMNATRVRHVYILGNPNLGPGTSAEEFLEGCEKLKEILDENISIVGACVREKLFEDVRAKVSDMVIFPMRLYLTYPWVDE